MNAQDIDTYLADLGQELGHAGRPQDLGDAQALCQQLGISTRDAARHALDTYITDDQIKQLNGVDITLLQLFP